MATPEDGYRHQEGDSLLIGDINGSTFRTVNLQTGIIEKMPNQPPGSVSYHYTSLAPGGTVFIGGYPVIYRVDGVSGQWSEVAGTTQSGYSGDGGKAIFAKMYNATSAVLDANGNLYIADSWNRVIRKVDHIK